MDSESRHGSYFVLLLLLMVSVLVLSSPLLLFYVSLPDWVNYLLTAVLAFVLGHVCAKFIEKITHREKKEVLAGTVIPLPAVVGLTVFVVLASSVSRITSLNALYSSLVYFVCFNIPFLVYFYEHERHKHHLVGFLVGVMFVALAYSLTFFAVSSIVSYSSDYQNVLSSPSDYSAVTNFVDDCISGVVKDKRVIGFSGELDISSYVDSNLGKCLNGFAAFNGQSFSVVSSASPVSTVVLNNDTISVTVVLPITITSSGSVTDISKFSVLLSR